MKISNILRLNTLGLAMVMLGTGCSDSFLEEKKNSSNTGPEIWEYYEGCLGRINNIYTVMLPVYNGESRLEWYPSSGNADIFSQSTEEYTGLSNFVDPGTILDNSSVPDWFYFSRKTSEGMYGRIRNCNDAIIGITNSTGITEEQRNELLGQAYFFRAWMYYRLVKVYGGVPIITTVDNAVSGVEIDVARSSTKDCVEFITEDLEKAAECLANSNFAPKTANFGRVTSGAALALMGRLHLLYASPVFNRADDETRWTRAYDTNKRALEALANDGFKLAYLGNADMEFNAKGWAKMFSDYNSEEAVFVTLYNKLEDLKDGTSLYKNNGWENSIRPGNTTGSSSGKTPSAMLVDMFPMADGRKSSYCETSMGVYNKLQSSELTYNAELPFVNRDPRFYRTFAFPGVVWQFKGNLSEKSDFSPETYPYSDGSIYELWNYAWYTDAANRDADDKSGFGADKLNTNYKGFYIRKKTDDFQLNSSSPLYTYNANNKFKISAAPYMEMRFAEVLLNYAEAACGAKQYSEAIKALVDIRKRVGYTEDNNYYGLGDLQGTADRAKLFSAILYERQIELAYEGKRFDDLRRWMLFDGGEGQASLKSTWALTGFGGNTCVYLGTAPLNGMRRDNLEFRVKKNNGLSALATTDPLAGVERPDAIDLNKALVNEDGTLAEQTQKLADFYTENLMRKARRGDEIGKVVSFQPEYYIIGLKNNAQSSNPGIEQTIGWGVYGGGGALGTFDPLAE